MSKTIDIMVDIETFATDYNAAIQSIGAVVFNADGENTELWNNSPDLLAELGLGFRVNVDLGKSAPEKRGNVDPATVEWWMSQGSEAQARLFTNERVLLGRALMQFAEWLSKQGSRHQIRLWSNGPTFDEIILRSAFDRYGIDFPVSFRGSRCCRTMTDLAIQFGWDALRASQEAPDDIVKHDALGDAVFQARSLASQRHFLRLTANVNDRS